MSREAEIWSVRESTLHRCFGSHRSSQSPKSKEGCSCNSRTTCWSSGSGQSTQDSPWASIDNSYGTCPSRKLGKRHLKEAKEGAPEGSMRPSQCVSLQLITENTKGITLIRSLIWQAAISSAHGSHTTKWHSLVHAEYVGLEAWWHSDYSQSLLMNCCSWQANP